MLIDLEDGKGIANVDSKSQRMLAFLACRSAIMAGDVLTKEVMKVLLIDLANTPNNTTCPHGRPTSTHLTVKELHREFKR